MAKYLYTVKNLPVEIIGDSEHWYKIRDIEKREGWISKSLIGMNDKYVVTTHSNTHGYNHPEAAEVRFDLDKHLVLKVKKCSIRCCYVTYQNYSFWVDRADIWGKSE